MVLLLIAGQPAARAAAPPPLPLAPSASPAPPGPTAPEGSELGSPQPADEAGILPPAIVEIPQSPQRKRWFGRASLGAVYRWAFDESMVGATLEGELGAHDANLAGGLRLAIEAGKMAVGLPYQVVSFGPFLWLPSIGQRVHVGFGLDTGAFLISRRTMPGSTLWSILAGGQVRASADLWRIGPSGALQADAGLAVQALTVAPGPLTVATTLGVGYRP
jgi:hypothetical protein